MRHHQHEAVAEATAHEPDDLDGVTGYEDGDGYVICETKNAKAWIRSDVIEPIPR